MHASFLLSFSYVNQLIKKSAPRLVSFSLLIVLLTTLSPFNFSLIDDLSVKTIANSFHHPSNVRDWLANILLFLPLGFSLTYLMPTRGLRWIGTLVVVLLVSFSLSLGVEVLQVFLPSRSPTLLDIFANSLGGFFGFLCFLLIRLIFLFELEKCLSIKKLVGSFLGYATIAFAILIALQNNTHLTNWDSTFPLSMGNESTGDRPWHGYISEVWISNRAISDKEVTQSFSRNYPTVAIEDSLVVFYQLIGQGSYADQAGHLPDLFWQGKLLDNQNRADVLLTPSHWLKTLTPATYLTQKICQASQFTLSTTVATANTTQSGLARIISLSGDPYHRNFTLGQEETNLVFRLRTPLTGENGTTPELIVPNVFADTNPHQLIITYDGSSLRLYIDQLKKLYSINLNSGLTLFQFLSPLDNDWSIQLNTFNPKISTMLCYALIFIPLGFILALITTIMRGKFIFYIFLICGGVVLPGLILEAMLAIENHRNMGLENTLTSIVITLVALLLFRVPFKTHLNFRQQL